MVARDPKTDEAGLARLTRTRKSAAPMRAAGTGLDELQG
jgi:hypothetical protein